MEVSQKMLAKTKNGRQSFEIRAARNLKRLFLSGSHRLCVAIFGKLSIIIFESGASLGYRINQRLRRLVRRRAGKHAQASAAILDSQSVETTDVAREAVSFDNGKKVKGRKRHILVDALGLLPAVCVHAAGVSETAGGRRVLAELEHQFWRLRLIWFSRRLYGFNFQMD